MGVVVKMVNECANKTAMEKVNYELTNFQHWHTLNQLTDNTGEQRKDVLKALNNLNAKYINGLWYK